MAPKPQPQPPAAAELQQQLADAWPAYRALLDGAADLRPEWKYYGVKYGWSLKLFKGSRNLCFIGHYDREFLVAFLFGERDEPRVLESRVPQALKDEFTAARRYAEGRPLRVHVRGPDDLPPVLELLDIKRTPRPPLKA